MIFILELENCLNRGFFVIKSLLAYNDSQIETQSITITLSYLIGNKHSY